VHEVSIVANIFRIMGEKLDSLGLGSAPVKKIKVVVGKFANVVPACLDFAFEMQKEGTPFEGAVMETEFVPLKIRCNACGEEMELDEPFLFCRRCDSFQVEIVAGKELYVDSFEIDDSEAPIDKEMEITGVGNQG
jgi:hydrogenase nickel incorporation protein HypA/HybF